MRPNPAIQSRQAHKRRKAFGRYLHRISALKHKWLVAWRKYRRDPWLSRKPEKFKVPRLLRHRKRELYRAFFRACRA